MVLLMRNGFIASALTLSLFSSGAQSAQFTDNGAITITGEIVDNTCVLSGQSRELVVDLPVVTSSEFSAVGDYAGDKPFDIVLEKCPKSVSTAKVSFEGERADSSEDLFAVHGEGSGVGFAIFDNIEGRVSAAPLKLGEQSRGYRLNADSNKLNFIARYRSTVPTSEINPGFVKTSGKFVVTYY